MDRTSQLFAAIDGNDLARLEEMLDEGASPDTGEPFDGTTLAMRACLLGLPAMLSLLIARGADIERKARASEMTCALCCFREDSHECLALLIAAGADLRATDALDRSPASLVQEGEGAFPLFTKPAPRCAALIERTLIERSLGPSAPPLAPPPRI